MKAAKKTTIMSDPGVVRLGDIVTAFNKACSLARPSFEIGCAYRMFTPKPTRAKLPQFAWWDMTDSFLETLAGKTFVHVFAEPREGADLIPLAGAIARYEPVLKKVPHYYFPSADAWNQKIIKGSHTIQQHFLSLQQHAINQGLFKELPKEKKPSDGAGLIALLELIAVYPDRAKGWIGSKKKARIVSRTLVIEDLQTCPFVSLEGRQCYKPNRGCLLVPFVAHDGRLVGHGLVVYDRCLNGGVDDLVRNWEMIFAATFAPLVANLNSAVLSALDGFFLGRVRELRHVMGSKTAFQNAPVPPRDCFVLNKIALYELLGSRLGENNKFRMVFFDLDGFKNVNQKIGHQAADVLLFYIAEQLTNLFSPKQDRWLCRFGGDEFVGIVPENDSLTVGEISDKIARAIQNAQNLYNENADKKEMQYGTRLTTSMGWVTSQDLQLYETGNGVDPDRKKLLRSMRAAYRLLELADSDTQERVKDLGKNGWLEFKKRMNLCADVESMCCQLSEWILTVNWLSPRRGSQSIRKSRIQLQFHPTTKGKS